ncbi:MAG: hypothetical protein WC979_03380 [Candidatus Pacearchaeota archaeon]|jgi:hypothetical protein|nr:hypothetical protein [Clostridia bacterium]
MKLLLFLLPLFLFACAPYDGPVNLVEVTHNSTDFGQVDTFIMGQPEIKYYNGDRDRPYLWASKPNKVEEHYSIDNVFKFKILYRLHTIDNDTAMYYDNLKHRTPSAKTKKCNAWYKF